MSTTISVLANETLCEIFQNVFHSQTVDEWHMQTVPSLRLVSHHWNETIETLPMLWTSILITEKSAYQSGQSPFQSTRLRLLRSLELPLNMHINLHISTKENSFNKSDAIILGEMIRTVAPRVASIELRTNSHARTIQMIILTSLNDIHMPLLHSFSHTDPKFRVLRHSRPPLEDGYFQNPSSILQFQGIPETRRTITEWGGNLYPSLTEIELVGVLYNLKHLPIMRGLRRLRIGAQPLSKRPSINQMLEILSPAKDTLEVLQLEDAARTNAANSIFGEPIIFQKLQILSLGYCHPDIAYTFLESARLPALVDLTITYTTSVPGYSDAHVCVYRSLIRHLPLDQIERLTLVNAVFSFYSNHTIDIPHPGEGMSEVAREAYMEKLKLRGFVPIDGCWKVPVFMFFLYGLRSLKHLHLCDPFSLKKIVGTYWQRGTLSTLETLHIDGSPGGLLELMQSVEDDRRFGNQLLSLQVSIGKDLKSVLSKEENRKLNGHIKALAEL